MNTAKTSVAFAIALLANSFTVFAVVAQSVINVTPKPNAQVTPSAIIGGTLKATNAVSIPVDSVKIFLDGKDVTPDSGINSTAFSYRPSTPLSVGTHTARVEFTGSDGIGRFVTWTFEVTGEEAIALQSITHNASNGLTNGSLFQTTMRGSANQKGSVLLIRSDAGGQTLQVFPAREVSPGEYIASFTIGSATLNEGIVLGRLQGSNNVAYAVANTPARFNPLAAQTIDPTTQVDSTEQTTAPQTPKPLPLKPSFTSHKDGDRIASRNGFTLAGQTRPGATVKVKVNAVPNNITGILGSIVGGTVLVDQSFTADQSGKFEVSVPKPLLVQRGTKYRVEAIAVSQNNPSSESVSMELIQD